MIAIKITPTEMDAEALAQKVIEFTEELSPEERVLFVQRVSTGKPFQPGVVPEQDVHDFDFDPSLRLGSEEWYRADDLEARWNDIGSLWW